MCIRDSNELNSIANKITSNPIYYDNGDLEIPKGIDLFIDDVLEGKFTSITEKDFRKVSFIEGRRSRLISCKYTHLVKIVVQN